MEKIKEQAPVGVVLYLVVDYEEEFKIFIYVIFTFVCI
jgi:hypothetical protein